MVNPLHECFQNYIEMRMGLGWLDKRKCGHFQRLGIIFYRPLTTNILVFDKCLFTYKMDDYTKIQFIKPFSREDYGNRGVTKI